MNKKVWVELFQHSAPKDAVKTHYLGSKNQEDCISPWQGFYASPVIWEDYKENEGTVVKPAFSYCEEGEAVLWVKVQDVDEYVHNKVSVLEVPGGEAIWGVRMASRVRIYQGMDRAQQDSKKIKETIPGEG